MKATFEPSGETFGLLCCVNPIDTGVAVEVRRSVIQRPPFGEDAAGKTMTARWLSGIQESCGGSSCTPIRGIFGKSRRGFLEPS